MAKVVPICLFLGILVGESATPTCRAAIKKGPDGAFSHGLDVITSYSIHYTKLYDGGGFRDLFDFCNRVDIKRLNKRVMEKLVLAGALDRLGPHRAALMASYNFV